jgi:hypothetical protein
VGHECDLAVLTVEDPAFWAHANGGGYVGAAELATQEAKAEAADAAAVAAEAVRQVRPLPMGDVPYLQEQVTVMVGPGRYCSPRHRVPCKSIIEGSKSVSGVDDVAGNGPGRYCSPRHQMPSD